jgi:hypothetical protein
MQTTEKLEQEVIDRLKAMQEEQNNMVIALGQLSIRKRQLQQQLDETKKLETEYGERVDTSVNEMNIELAELDKKYPNGQIDLEAGTVIY